VLRRRQRSWRSLPAPRPPSAATSATASPESWVRYGEPTLPLLSLKVLPHHGAKAPRENPKVGMARRSRPIFAAKPPSHFRHSVAVRRSPPQPRPSNAPHHRRGSAPRNPNWRAVLRRRPLPPRASATLSQCPKPRTTRRSSLQRPTPSARQRPLEKPNWRAVLRRRRLAPRASAALSMPKNPDDTEVVPPTPRSIGAAAPLENQLEGGAPSPPTLVAKPAHCQRPDHLRRLQRRQRRLNLGSATASRPYPSFL
jgi:hypothetical protein